MNYLNVIGELTSAHGVTGNENDVAKCVMSFFKRYSKEVWRDKAGSVFAKLGDGKPVVLVCAHMDEIGMVVNKIEDNGMLRLVSVAGVDPRTLPGSEVVVHARTKNIKAVIGATPPHLLPGGAKKAYRLDELVCDTGMSRNEVDRLIEIGDFVTFATQKPLELKNNRAAGKTFDDRALVAAEIRAMEILSKRSLDCTVVFCATVQEEKGGLGATASTWGVDPDIGLAVDVTHAPTPGTPEFRTYPMDSIEITTGGNIHPRVFELLCSTAKAHNIKYEVGVAMGSTGTDAWDMQIQRAGVRCGLVSLPIRYMHTSVETASLDTLENCARMIAEFVSELGEGWEEKLCFCD